MPANAAFMADHAIRGYPTLLILDPATGRATSQYAGTATAAELVEFFDLATVRPSGDAADQAFLRGEDRLAASDWTGAVTGYEQAIAAGGTGWPRHDHAVEQLISALASAGDNRGCIERAAREAPRMPRSHAFVNVVLTGVTCLRAEPSLVAGGAADQASDKASDKTSDKIEALAAEATDSPSASEDDHYWLYEARYAVRTAAQDPVGARAIAERYLAFVESAPPVRSDDERAARDLARVRAATKLGDPARAIPALEASERAMPRDDGASARLCTAYTAAGRGADAIAACTRGLGRAPGPSSTVRLLVARARARAAINDTAAARSDLALARSALDSITAAPERSAAEQMIRAVADTLASAAPAH